MSEEQENKEPVEAIEIPVVPTPEVQVEPSKATQAEAEAEAIIADANPAEPKHSPEEVAEEKVIIAGNDGVTDGAKNVDVLAAALDAEGDDDDEEFIPSFFIEEDDRHRVELDCLFEKATKRITSVTRSGVGIDFAKYKSLHHTEEWFEFSVPDYEDVSKYRQRSTVYRQNSGVPVVDSVQVRNFLLVWHLKDWSLRDRNGEKVKLEFEDAGSLTDESVRLVYSLPSAIIDVMLTILERDVLLSD